MKRDRELQRLILLQVRDAQPPPGLDKYSEDEQVYNSALLINDDCVEGKALKDAQGIYVSAAMTALTSRGHDLLERLTQSRGQDDFDARPKPGENMISIFISHSSQDVTTAEALANLLRSALNLPADQIRCTSVTAYRLPGGVDTDERLRQEIRESKAFVGLVTPSSIASIYVLFELGARWGARLHFIPLLAAGADNGLLKGPLSGINGLDCGERDQILQLVRDVADVLGVQPASPHTYGKLVDALHELARRVQSNHTVKAVPTKHSTLGDFPDEERMLLEKSGQTERGDILRTSTRGGLTITVDGEVLVMSPNGKIVARWQAAIKRLVTEGLIHQSSDEVFQLTEAGYAVVAASTKAQNNPATAAEELSPDAKRFLKEASKGSSGIIYLTEHLGGVDIVASGAQILSNGVGKNLAHWRAVIRELTMEHLIENCPEGYVVTEAGYQAAAFIP